jgi:Ser/Thr protein kinase RdoA (MazF antagonist)
MIPFFPASYSTLSADALALWVADQYGFGIPECRFISRGVNDTYLLESTDRRFILRVYRYAHRDLPQIQNETALLLASWKAEVPVYYPVADQRGEVIQTINAIEGQRYAILFSYAPGRSVQLLSANQLRVFGQQMARFHNVSSTIKLENHCWIIDFETTLIKPLELLKPRFAEMPEDYKWLEQSAHRVMRKMQEFDTSAFSTGYCQFDFLPKNFHFDGDAITFFDFDFMGYGWLVNDLMSFWQHLCLDVFVGRLTQEAANTAFAVFIGAYREQRNLSAQEQESIPYLALSFWLFYMGFHTTHDQFFPFTQPSHLKFYTGFLKQLVEKHWDNEA